MNSLMVLNIPGTAVAVFLLFVPLSSDVPSAETLMAWIIACEMTVLCKPLLFMATGEVDLLVKAHLKCVGCMTDFSVFARELQSLSACWPWWNLTYLHPEHACVPRTRDLAIVEYRCQMNPEQACGARVLENRGENLGNSEGCTSKEIVTALYTPSVHAATVAPCFPPSSL
jgi:hypothetical protein